MLTNEPYCKVLPNISNVKKKSLFIFLTLLLSSLVSVGWHHEVNSHDTHNKLGFMLLTCYIGVSQKKVIWLEEK